MERPVKERLIGAAVLMAAAIILIPEMLSGPDRDPAETPAAAGQGAIKTYTIDLSKSPGTSPPSAAPDVVDSRTPPPEETPPPTTSAEPSTTAQASPEPTTPIGTEPPAERSPAPTPAVTETPRPEPRSEPPPRQIAAAPARAEAPPQAAPEPKVETPPARQVASAPTAPRSAVPTGGGWAVQLGSYSSEATAERLMNEWRGKGQDAFVMPVKSGGKTLYRVRIGPSKDRAGAETVLKAVKPSVAGAAIVAHP